MTSRDSKAFRTLMGTLCVVYQQDFDEVQSRFYWDALKDLDLGELQQAAVAVAQEQKWFPKPADLRAMVYERRAGLQAAREAQLLAAPVDVAASCDRCDDTGWEPTERGVRICACRETNQTYQRKRLQERVAAHAQGKLVKEPSQRRLVDVKQLAGGE